jgi:uncharacterized membrane protein YccC
VATFAGVAAAGLLLRRGPTEIALAIVTVAAIAAMVAVRTSRWYIVPAGSGIVVLLASGAAGTHVLDVTFTERIAETALGAGLALTFGVAIPSGLRWFTRRRAAGRPASASSPPADSSTST